MKKLLSGLVLAAFSLWASATTLNPVQLLNPAGSSSGQTIVSTGASSAPGWGNVPVANVTGAAPLASPALTGTPIAPTASIGTNTTQIATTAFVQSALPAGFTAYAPSVSATSGTYTSASATGAYSKTGKLVCFWINATITTVGTGTSTIVTLPFASATTSGGTQIFAGRENAVSGKMLQGVNLTNSSNVTIFDYSNLSAAANGAQEQISGCYISQ